MKNAPKQSDKCPWGEECRNASSNTFINESTAQQCKPKLSIINYCPRTCGTSSLFTQAQEAC